MKNKAQPICEIDMPDAVASSLKLAIDGAVLMLKEKFSRIASVQASAACVRIATRRSFATRYFGQSMR